MLQGEGGTIQELLSNTASLTSTLADRDQLIGDVITNLSTLMETVDDHHQELDELIVSMKSWFGDLAKDRKVIGSSLTSIADVTETVADLLTQARPLIKEDVAQLRRLFTLLAKPENKAYLDETLDKLPDMLTKQTRIGVYGSWYNYYLCEFHFGIVLPSVTHGRTAGRRTSADLGLHDLQPGREVQLMARRSDSQVLRLGAVSIAVLLLVMVASFNIQKLPWFRGTTFHAELTDASGLRTGSEVQVAGVRVGRVSKLQHRHREGHRRLRRQGRQAGPLDPGQRRGQEPAG